MKKTDFILHLAEKLGVSKSEADNIFIGVFETMTDVLVSQDKMLVPDFGTFSTRIRAERTGRNPSTGNTIVIPRTVVVNFKPVTKLKEKVNSSQ